MADGKMHVGLIPDGNRRFMAKQHIRNLLKSYDMGINKFYDFLEWCYDLRVGEVTIYALSLENIVNRDRREIDTLFKVFNRHAKKGVKDKTLHEKEVRVNVCGDRDYILNHSQNTELAEKMITNLGKLEDATRDYGKFTLNLAIGYGGRQEVLNAVKSMVDQGVEINEENLKDNLWVKSYPELIIRTSEDRLSNFLLWQSAYSEIYFVPKLWQEFQQPDLVEILDDFNSRERRYGR
ncbi:MAG: di-trans,poly-cis-decaprenylcistransferase [Candidatus Altiarchaeales archaeon]|nr:di-trans,poly-cis-decaprenylcistransferase [Candidatus Altiarchaeales archaeon]MBD3417087.1 di-trans,poly-cis-decaprenylcistransferase [Candidatus Altiarchaeales archaeon]